MAGSRYFFFRRLYSLSGLIPLGLFLLEHLFSNSMALYGPERFNQWAETLHSLPFLILIELLFIILPILYHGIYGLYVAFTGQVNVGRYGYARNWTYLFQRITGVIIFGFVLWHLWALRLQSLLYGTKVDFDLVASILRNPVGMILYGVATISAVFHFTNGLWNLAVDWGFAAGRQAQATVWKVSWALFFVLSALTLGFMVAFIQGGLF